MVLTWKSKLFYLRSPPPTDRFIPAHFCIGFNPICVHSIPWRSDGQIPGDPHWLGMEKYQPVPGDPVRCTSSCREAFQSSRAVCLGGNLGCYCGSVRNPFDHLQKCLSIQVYESSWSDDHDIHVLSCKRTYRVQINASLGLCLTTRIISLSTRYCMQASPRKKAFQYIALNLCITFHRLSPVNPFSFWVFIQVFIIFIQNTFSSCWAINLQNI